MTWSIYLSGEIHTDWRDQIEDGARTAGLDVTFAAPVTDHPASDDCGVAILGPEPNTFWHDHKGAKLNAIRTRTALEAADVVIVRFGIGMNTDHTLEEVGQQFSVTRERIRQIEAKALRKLNHPSRSRTLRSFLDT